MFPWQDENAIKAHMEIDPAYKSRRTVDGAFKARVKAMQFDEIVTEVNLLIDNPTSENLSKLEWMTIAGSDHYSTESGIYLTRVFLALGEDGIKRLESLLDPMNGLLNHQNIVETIYLACSKQLVPFIDQKINARADIRQPVITDSMVTLATEIFENMAMRIETDNDIRQALLSIMYYKGAFGFSWDPNKNVYKNITKDIFDIVTSASMKRMLAEFEALIKTKQKEEVYQKFLEEHPVLLDPLAQKVLFKQRLGDDFTTDFAIETLDGRYLLIEIEKPHSPIFIKTTVKTQNGSRIRYDFSADFSHALGQVLDFQQWVEKYHQYANDKMKGIASPPGLLVIGLRSNLSQDEKEKLERMNIVMRGNI